MKKIALAISAVLLLYVAPRAFAAGDGSEGLSQEEIRTDLAKLRRVHSDDESDRSSAYSDDDGDDDGGRGGDGRRPGAERAAGGRGGDHDGSGSQDHDSGNDGGHDDGGHDHD